MGELKLRGVFEVKDSDFQQLLASVKEAGRIKRGEQEPARKFEVRAEDGGQDPAIMEP